MNDESNTRTINSTGTYSVFIYFRVSFMTIHNLTLTLYLFTLEYTYYTVRLMLNGFITSLSQLVSLETA